MEMQLWTTRPLLNDFKINISLNKPELESATSNIFNRTDSSVHMQNGLSPFVQTEATLFYFHYVFAGYLLPIVVALGLLENGICVWVLARLSGGIGRTARVYYITLSLADMGLLVAQIYNMWLSMGLQFATGGTFYLDVCMNINKP